MAKTINTLLQTPSLELLLMKNKEFLEQYKQNSLIKVISGEQMAKKYIRERLLDSIQVFSDYFQKVVMLRSIFSEDTQHKLIANKHLEEEFQHNLSLEKDRNNRPAIWDPILDATSCWFAWKMFTTDSEEKTVLIHLVLETSANLFFQKANTTMTQYRETNYFDIHADLDETHEKMGIDILKNLTADKYSRLLLIQQHGWDVLNVVCNRIATLINLKI